MEEILPASLVQALKHQKYHLVGHHSAVKACKWLHESLVNRRTCYKSKFYNIQSHRCLQVSPTITTCNFRCRFCWRVQPEDIGVEWNELKIPVVDEPNEIAEGCIKEQLRIVSGYKGNPKVDLMMYEEARRPAHAAISLTGEPTLYEKIGDLISEFHKRNMTTFLVTNGTNPGQLEALDEEPTQLYVSIYGPDKQTHSKIARPLIPRSWELINKTLELFPSFRCRTTVRLTLVKDYNLTNSKGYAKLIKKAQPMFVEAKAYFAVGYSRRRLGLDYMPSHAEIKEFSTELAKELEYDIVNESLDSRVVLLTRGLKTEECLLKRQIFFHQW